MYLTTSVLGSLGAPRGIPLYAQRAFKKHFGVGLYGYAGVISEVIHPQPTSFGQPITVVMTDFAGFAQGDEVYIAKTNPKFTPQEIAERAEEMLGSQDYDLLKNNCEHMSMKAATGEGTSEQIKSLGQAALVILGFFLLAKAG